MQNLVSKVTQFSHQSHESDQIPRGRNGLDFASSSDSLVNGAAVHSSNFGSRMKNLEILGLAALAAVSDAVKK
jgi:hypothetical protein